MVQLRSPQVQGLHNGQMSIRFSWTDKQIERRYHTSHNWVYSCQYHVVWCPKYRRKVLVAPIDTRLKELILEKQGEYGYQVIDMAVMPDHVH